MILATKTLAAIDAAMRKDEGGRFRALQRHTLPQCEDAYREGEDAFRSHLGASLIGQECWRALWYSFRWAAREKPEPHMMRLWNRGHLEEGRMVALLQMIGVTMYQFDANGNQYRISGAHGHYGGGLDGVGVGIPDFPVNTPALTEFKTHNDKSFKKLVDAGVQQSKPEHYVQMQSYGRKHGLSHALYMATNKNDDRLHAEIVTINDEVGAYYERKAEHIIFAEGPPERISETPGWFECSWCKNKPFCHGLGLPEKNCRTCRHSRVATEGRWGCQLKGVYLDKPAQLAGCSEHSYIRGMARSLS